MTSLPFFLFLQHWIANNLFGLAFALNGVELLHLNNVSTGCILLGGLFVYDVFWVSLLVRKKKEKKIADQLLRVTEEIICPFTGVRD